MKTASQHTAEKCIRRTCRSRIADCAFSLVAPSQTQSQDLRAFEMAPLFSPAFGRQPCKVGSGQRFGIMKLAYNAAIGPTVQEESHQELIASPSSIDQWCEVSTVAGFNVGALRVHEPADDSYQESKIKYIVSTGK